MEDEQNICFRLFVASYLMYSSRHLSEVCITIDPIWQMENLRLREFRQVAQDELANVWQSQDSNPGLSDFKALALSQGFSPLAQLTFGAGQLRRGAYPVHWKMSDSILDFYLLDASRTLLPQLWQPQLSPDIVKCSLGAKLLPSENSCFWLADWATSGLGTQAKCWKETFMIFF